MTRLTMTKLVVENIEQVQPFYEQVCDLKEVRQIEADLNGRAIREVILTAPDSMILVLFQYLDGSPVQSGEVMLVFETDDLDAFLHRAIKAGGSVAVPMVEVPGARYVYVQDPEGHMVEAIERTS